MKVFWFLVINIIGIFILINIFVTPTLKNGADCLNEEADYMKQKVASLETVSDVLVRDHLYCDIDADSYDRLKSCLNKEKTTGFNTFLIEIFPGFHDRMIDRLEQHNRSCQGKLTYP